MNRAVVVFLFLGLLTLNNWYLVPLVSQSPWLLGLPFMLWCGVSGMFFGGLYVRARRADRDD